MAFEKKVVRFFQSLELGRVRYHDWIEYVAQDAKKQFAEPEGFIVFPRFVFLFECKLTGGIDGKEQMENYYAPLLSHIHERPVRCLLVCRATTPGTPGPYVSSVEQFLAGPLDFATLHLLL